MNLCRVLGTVVATEKHPAFVGRKLLIVQPLDEKQQPLGNSFIAVDGSSCAGEGDLVLVMREGNGVRQILKEKNLPIRSLIVGVVDEIDVPQARTEQNIPARVAIGVLRLHLECREVEPSVDRTLAGR